MASETLFFAGFQEGEWGEQGSWQVGWGLYRQRLYYRGWWSGTNVVRYANGSLGPRMGLRDITPGSGMPAGSFVCGGWEGGVFHWAQVGTTFGYFDNLGSGWVNYGGVAGPVTGGVAASVRVNTVTYVAYLGTQIYKIDHGVARTVSILAGSPTAINVIASYGDRLVTVDNTVQNRVLFSAAGDFTSWPAANFFDVGSGAVITGLYVVRGTLVITLNNDEVWVLTGVPGVNDTLRRMTTGLGVPAQVRGTVVSDNNLWFIPTTGDYPAEFTGGTIREVNYLSYAAKSEGTAYSHRAAPINLHRGDFAFITSMTGRSSGLSSSAGTGRAASSTNRGLLHRNNCWSFHSFGQSIVDIMQGPYGQVVLVTRGGAPKFLVWQAVGVERPPTTPMGLVIPESATDAGVSFVSSFDLPEYYGHAAQELSVRGVYVDFSAYPAGLGTAQFDVVLTPMRQTTPGSTPASDGVPQTQSYSEAAPASTVTRKRFLARFSGAPANGFQLSFNNLQAVAIEKIEVAFDTRPPQGI